jgi:alkylmercury lyase
MSERSRVALATYNLVAEGSPAPVSEVAQRAGARGREVEELLGSWPGVFRDADGAVVGFWGLTVQKLVPTHRMVVGGQEVFAWCAWDTLFLPALLGATTQIESTCPTTRAIISLEVSPRKIMRTSHPSAQVSFLVPERVLGPDVIESFCHFVHFFSSPEAGRAWTARHEGTFLLSLEEAFELGRLVNARNFPSLMEGAA